MLQVHVLGVTGTCIGCYRYMYLVLQVHVFGVTGTCIGCYKYYAKKKMGVTGFRR